jgi:hypothetical protein
MNPLELFDVTTTDEDRIYAFVPFAFLAALFPLLPATYKVCGPGGMVFLSALALVLTARCLIPGWKSPEAFGALTLASLGGFLYCLIF